MANCIEMRYVTRMQRIGHASNITFDGVNRDMRQHLVVLYSPSFPTLRCASSGKMMHLQLMHPV